MGFEVTQSPGTVQQTQGVRDLGPIFDTCSYFYSFPKSRWFAAGLGLQDDSLSRGRRQGFPPPLLSELPPPPLHFAGTWGGELGVSRCAVSTPASVLPICFLPSSPLLKVKGKIPTEEFKGHLRSLLYMVTVDSSNFQSPPLFMIPKQDRSVDLCWLKRSFWRKQILFSHVLCPACCG